LPSDLEASSRLELALSIAGKEEGPPAEGALRGPAHQHQHMFTLRVIYSNGHISADNSGLCSVSEKASCNLSASMGFC